MYLRISRFAVFIAALFSAAVALADEQVLYWMVYDSATVNDHGTESTIADFSAAHTGEGETFAARVRVTGGGLTEDTFLDLYYADDLGGYFLVPGEYGVDFAGTGSGYVGAGVPTGNQSPSGEYAHGSPEYMFAVELGNVEWSGDDAVNWTTLATTGPVSYTWLAEQGYIKSGFDLNPPSGQIWTPTSFNVPEPSGGLLFIVGGALLALRRKRRSA